MKSRKARFIIISLVVCALLIAVGTVLLWLFDNVFNGFLIDGFTSFILGYDDNMENIVIDRSRLNAMAFTAIVVLAILLSATGALCAYGAYKEQRKMLIRAREEARRANELAKREMRRKSDLITYLAHDLKTPLASVIAYLSLLDEAKELPQVQRAKYVGIALDKAYRLERLIGELFEIIRFNLQTVSINREKINLKLMLEQLADEFYPILLARGISASVDCEDGLVLRGDSDKLARVFNNILKNAAAYSDADSVIRIEAERRDSTVTIRFINTGDPIPAEKREVIFEKFYRLDTSRSAKTGGAGLGLAIAKQIVEAHKGAISVESDEEHTVFTVTLPM